ncbi:unnamed protein product, partial [Amoebophrya sp. A25]
GTPDHLSWHGGARVLGPGVKWTLQKFVEIPHRNVKNGTVIMAF